MSISLSNEENITQILNSWYSQFPKEKKENEERKKNLFTNQTKKCMKYVNVTRAYVLLLANERNKIVILFS